MHETQEKRKLIDLDEALRDKPVKRALYHSVRLPFDSLFSIRKINQAYHDTVAAFGNGEAGRFFDVALNVHGATYEVNREQVERIPREGPVVVVANHVFGGLDALILCHLLTGIRDDAKAFANSLLSRMPEAHPWLILVDPFGGGDAARHNMAPLKEAMRWLDRGGMLGAFPSGEVAHFSLRERMVREGPWFRQIGRLIKRSKATVVPVYFHGRNSALFQAAGMLSPRLRTAMLPRELMNKTSSNIHLTVGNPIPFSRFAGFSDEKLLIDHLRLCTYVLSNRRPVRTPRFRPSRLGARGKPIPDASDVQRLTDEIAHLPADQLVSHQGEFSVYASPSQNIPHLLQEIGRLRELTFREVGEGSGNAIDLEPFDAYYLHLFLWNERESEIVGAYRMGLTDMILPQFGPKGLYTSTLFKFKPEFVHRLDPAIELGRSFIRSKYQKQYNALSLLWKGIGAYVARHPRYKTLFGPVSISKEYDSISKNLIVKYLRKSLTDNDLAQGVKPRKPFRAKRLFGFDEDDISSSLHSTLIRMPKCEMDVVGVDLAV